MRHILTINPQATPGKRGGAAAMADTAAAPAELTPLQQAVGLTRNFVAGTFAGIMECLVGHPLVSAAPGALDGHSFRHCSCSPTRTAFSEQDTLKVRMQTASPGSANLKSLGAAFASTLRVGFTAEVRRAISVSATLTRGGVDACA